MNLVARIRRDFQRLLRSNAANTALVTVVWNAASTGGSFDPNIEGSYPAALMQSGTWPALVHYVQPAMSMMRQFAEVQVGDAIIDFPAGPDPNGKVLPVRPQGARFFIEGDERVFVQKQVGKGLADAWDVVIGGQHAMRTFLLTQEGA